MGWDEIFLKWDGMGWDEKANGMGWDWDIKWDIRDIFEMGYPI